MQQGTYPPAPGEPSQGQLVNTQQISSYKQLLLSTIQEKQLQFFYSSNNPRLDHAGTLAATHMDEVCTRWSLPLCQDLGKVALFDIILFIANSASLALEEDGGRLDDLHAVCSSLCRSSASSMTTKRGI